MALEQGIWNVMQCSELDLVRIQLRLMQVISELLILTDGMESRKFIIKAVERAVCGSGQSFWWMATRRCAK